MDGALKTWTLRTGRRLRAISAPFAKGKRATSGAAAIEFAMVGPLLGMLLVVSADFSLAFYSDMQVQTSAQSGAQYAAVYGFNATAISSAVTNATSTSGISASPAPSQFCGCPTSSAVTSTTCGTTCSDGMTAGTYIKVTATRTYSTILAYPIVPTSFTQVATSTVRIK
ncbi:MAG: pilus assembly protein [Proteobacteria bacterium]|nr:pilus assembly protein [Pseudomonadota bacterium]